MSKPCLFGGVTCFLNFPYKVFEGFSNLTSSLPDSSSRYGAPFMAGSHCLGIQFLRFQFKNISVSILVSKIDNKNISGGSRWAPQLGRAELMLLSYRFLWRELRFDDSLWGLQASWSFCFLGTHGVEKAHQQCFVAMSLYFKLSDLKNRNFSNYRYNITKSVNTHLKEITIVFLLPMFFFQCPRVINLLPNVHSSYFSMKTICSSPRKCKFMFKYETPLRIIFCWLLTGLVKTS